MTADSGDDSDAPDFQSDDSQPDVPETEPDDAEPEPDDAEGWKFGLDEVDEDGVVDDRETIEPGSPSLESAAFVLLGALVTIGIIVRVAMVFGV